ncbi:MAG: YbaK/EbsC family protein [Deltaproteobacteria bacterium]|jgi:prolyl-tRNA editing enzyme YbaK/EbsC (Cys-tRNA(Pro) deacylase)|nr:YbaK/EbsC family protein [Deltaproteobacteria bacterium]
MSVEAVRTYLEKWGKGGAVREFNVSSATVELAAQALGVEGKRIAKTLSFKGKGEADASGAFPVILVVAAGDAKVDNTAFKDQFGFKAKMLSPDEALAGTGHAVGGVCPFALTNPRAEVYLDVSLKRFSSVFPACGSGNSAVELTCDELFEVSGAREWVDVCKAWRGDM